MNRAQAKKIIWYVVQKTQPRWQQYDEDWDKIDEVFVRRGYEQGGFSCEAFAKLLRRHGILSIGKLGLILDGYSGEKKYARQFAGAITSAFYQKMKQGVYGDEGKEFCQCVHEFKASKGRAGAWFWTQLWRMLVCCNHLKRHYRGSFSYFLKKKYAEFKGMVVVSDSAFLDVSPEDWQQFKRSAKPWKELYGIGENVFDYIVGDTRGAKFIRDSYKLDSANLHFLKITGLYRLAGGFEREAVVDFLTRLNLPYSLREINKGMYTYCSETEAKRFGFCRDPKKCVQCGVNDVCAKEFS